jgi:ATP-binding cassette subfamily F protein 3
MNAELKETNLNITNKPESDYHGTVLSVKDISFYYGERKLLEDITFNLNAGEKVALIGPNGTGKSTLIHIIMGNLEPDDGFVNFRNNIKIGYLPQTIHEIDLPKNSTVGNFIKSSQNLPEIENSLNKITSQLAKDPKDLALLKKYGNLQEAYEIKGGYIADHKVLKLLDGLNIENVDLETPINHLSGGQKTRLLLGRVLFSEPDLLLLDEPTNHLDKPVLDWLAKYLETFKGAVLIVSHEKDFLDKVVRKVIKLNEYDGKIQIFDGNYSEAFEKMQLYDKQMEKERQEQEKELQKLYKTINLWRQRGKRAKIASQLEKKVAVIKDNLTEVPQKDRNVFFKIEINEHSYKNVMKIKNLKKSYGDNEVVKDVNLNIERGQRVGILGPNGAGKTTLLKMITGQTKSDRGEIDIGEKVSIGYYAQEQENLQLNNTVRKEILSVSSGLNEQDIRSFLGQFGLTGNIFHQKISTLSPGERTKLSLAKIMITGCNTLILDEPTNHLDLPSQKRLAEFLKAYKGTIIITSHNNDLLDMIDLDIILIMPEEEVIF